MIPKTRSIRKITRKTKNSTFAMLAAPAAMSVKPRAAATSEMRKKRRAQRSMSASFLHRREPVRLAAGRGDLDCMPIAHRNTCSGGRRFEGGFFVRIRAGGAAVVRDTPAALVGHDPVDCGTHLDSSAQARRSRR